MGLEPDLIVGRDVGVDSRLEPLAVLAYGCRQLIGRLALSAVEVDHFQAACNASLRSPSLADTE